MRIGHIEFGRWVNNSPWTLKEYLELSRAKCPCGCIIITISIFYITWLKNECYK